MIVECTLRNLKKHYISSPLIRTINDTSQTPKNRTFPELCETFGKLKQIGKLLKQNNLLNSKYLYLRSNTYCFVLKVKNSFYSFEHITLQLFDCVVPTAVVHYVCCILACFR